MHATTIERLRYFLKDNIRQEVDFSATEQARGLPPPPIEKPWDPNAKRLDLSGPDRWPNVGQITLDKAIRDRVSHRRFDQVPLQIDELAFLLWATQGIRKQLDAGTALRTVPSATKSSPWMPVTCARTCTWHARRSGLVPVRLQPTIRNPWTD